MKRIVVSTLMLVMLTSFAFSASFGAFGGISEGVSFTPTFTVPIDPLSVGLDLMFA